ncbi:MAG: phosphatidylglycerophosphatase A [Ignavibacteriae bacterium HGW-Ignavibacteriae-2]|nr:phosphatidylglycerophosphatase A [Bacteroidota bacterium]PKL87353.1 MAG: phosphatidylglycerophosphatase A [Ignavibacteriae bacterium HGW-Ignavibacteriae-2]
MKINFLEKIIGSAFFTGYIPFASGTFGSLAALAIYLIPGFENPTIMIFMISLFIVVGIKIGDKFEAVYGKDPSQCTIDEVVGTWITLLFVPKKIVFIAIAFIIWRLLDIFKPFPANAVERFKGGRGIMLDDIIAGVYSFLIIQIIIYIVY